MNSEIKEGDKIYFFLDKTHNREQRHYGYSSYYNNNGPAMPKWEIQERDVIATANPYNSKEKILCFCRFSSSKNTETLREYRDKEGNFKLRHFNNILVDVFKYCNLYISKNKEKLEKVLEKRKKFDRDYVKNEKAMAVAKISLDESELTGKLLTSKRSNSSLQKYYYVESIKKDIVSYRDLLTHKGTDLIIGRSYSEELKYFLDRCKDDKVMSIENTLFYETLKIFINK